MASAIEVKRRPSLGDIKVESRLKGGATEEHAHTQADREHGPGGIDPSSTIFQSLSITLNEAVGSATISPSGRDVCLAARKGLYIVDLDDPWAPPRFLPYYSAIVADVQWSPHPSRAHWVMSTSGEKGLVWNLALQGSASPIEHICLGHERALTDMNWAVFQVDTLATCGIDGNVLVYDLRQGGRSPSARYSGWRYGATQVKYNRQNPNELASSHGEYVYIWDDRKGSVPVTIVRAHNQKIYGIDYSRKKADRLVTCSLDSTVKYWHLDGSPEISEPTQTLQTSSPVWRARHTPFGDGLVTLPQRSEYAVKFWSAATQEEVFKLTGHNDIVREFLWRTKGGDNPEDDDRVFQLVTWGSDNQLLLTPIPPAIPQKVGHVPHSPIEVRHLRRNAENRSYRDLLPSPSMLGTSGKSPAPAGMQGGSGLSPTTQLVTTSGSGSHSSGFGQGTKMTHPAHYSPQQQPLSSARLPLSLASASRYGRSANSSSSAGNSPVYGTSPAGDSMMHSRGVYLASDRRVLAGGSSSSMSGSNRYSVSVPRSHSHMHLASSGASMQSPTVPTHSASQFSADSRTSLYDKRAVASPRAPPHPSAQQAPQQQGAFMTRASGRRPRGHEAVDWMENVRIVSGGAQESTQSAGTGGTTMAGSMLVDGVEIGTGMEDSVTALGTADGASTVQGGQGDRDSVPLHEELTALARRFESTVRFEKIAIPQRTITVALYGPWAISGQPTLLRATFVFPPSYPAMSPPNIDIERNNNLSNKVRAKLLIGVRGTAQRYTTKRRNSLEACLTYLLGGKVLEPEDVSDEEDGLADEIAGTHLLIKEEDDVEEEEDLERFLANRNCPAPRRCGAVFTPNGTLITFFPVDSLHQSRHADKRSRSKSPSTDGKKERQHRRRLFESFGVIPSLQVRSAREVGAEEALDDEMEEDSDEVLNIPSLLMTRRRQSRGRTESVGGTSHYTLSRLHGKSFNPRVYLHDCSQIIGIDTSLSSLYTLQGHLPTIVQANCRAISKTDTTWAIKRTWTCLQTMLLAVDSEPLPFHPTRHGTLILGQSLSERLVMDMLDIFYKLGDIQMLGMLSCLLELDRRQLRATTQQQRPRFSRSPANSGALDYFSIKPVRPSRTSNSPHLLQTHSESRNAPPTPQANAPLKSPSAAWLASSYGTQNSGGSGSRGSSWANNLSSFFRAGGTAGFGASGEGSNTARSAGSSTPPIAGQGSTGSISPAFVKRAHMAPLTEVKRAGGIASGRPQIVTKSSRVARGVSFAGADNDSIIPPSRPPSGVIVTPQPRAHGRSNKITIRHTDTFRASEASLFLKPQVQQQLEYYRLLYSDLLLRLQLPLQRTWVLKLTKSAVDGGNVDLIRGLCGIDNDSKHVLRLEFPCPKCKQPLNGRSPGWCNTCHQRRRAAPCVLCHLPLGGLTETCLTCLHTCHLHCLQEWRAQDGGNACPASCGCECATLGTVEASKTEDDGLSDAFKSPLLVV